MQNKTQSATILVDGSVLKKEMAQKGQKQTPQQIIQYLSRMVRVVRQENPGALVYIQYYGARLNEPVKLPISGVPYVEPELKKGLTHHSVPGAWLNNTWGKVTYPPNLPWILRASSLNKKELTDEDFIFNEKPKGVLSQLVGQMAEYAVCHPESPLYVYGDVNDMAYAIHTAQWLGMQVKEIEFVDKKTFISDIPILKEPRFFDKERMLYIGQNMKAHPDSDEFLKELRAQCPEQDRKSVLMVDAGVVRKYLEQKGYEMTPNNTQEILNRIMEMLPERPSKTVLYCGFATPKKLVSPFPGDVRAMQDASIDKRILSLQNVEFSVGKTIQDERYPFILKKDGWRKSPESRDYKDFEYYFHQCDVDDRIAYDISLYSMDPSVSQLYFVATDGDFVTAVEKAWRRGLPTQLVLLNSKKHDLSFRLEQGVQSMIEMAHDSHGLRTRFAEEEKKRKIQQVQSNIKRKKIGKMKRAYARAAAEDDDYSENIAFEVMRQRHAHRRK